MKAWILGRLLACVLASSLITLITIPTAFAQYPTKPIKMLIGYPPGSATDLFGRFIGDYLQRSMGQPIVIENRPGAAGNIAAEAAVRAPHDGYTLLNSASQIVINPFVQKLSFDPTKDLIPVTQTIGATYVLVTRSDFPANDLAGLIKHIKEKPGAFDYGSYGQGSGPHLTMAMLQRLAGMKAEHIAYRGSPQMLTAVIAGEIDMAFDTSTSVASHIESGRLKAIAVAGPQPLDVLPGIEPIAKTFPGFNTDGWQGIFVPAGTPQNVVLKLNAEIVKALKSPEFKTLADARGVAVVGSTQKEFEKYFKEELKKYEQVVKENDIRLE
ncbi:MAG TPA: tripartite tricarboxylate transporter substrate binding protein [Eoetvoesiella sp.]